MYTAKQKDSFVSKAVSLIIWGLLHPNCKYDDFYSLSFDGDVQPHFTTVSISTQSFEYLFDVWKEGIEVCGNAYENEYVPELEYDEDLLGLYTPMSSPGRITLFLQTIRDEFNKHIQDLIRAGYSVTYSDIKNLAYIFIRNTVYHEYFHHYTDIQRYLFGSYHSKDTEEALAVAWSRMKIEQYTKNKKYWKTPVNTPPYERFKRNIYNYRQPGYKDWILYYDQKSDDKSIFCDTVRTYTLPSGSTNLKENGVDFNVLILNDIDAVYQTSDAVTLHFSLQ